MAIGTILAIGTLVLGAVGVGVGIIQTRQAAKVQANQVRSQSAAREAEIKRQVAFEEAQLAETRRVQRLNADVAEVKRQRDLRRVLSSQVAGAAGRFDPLTSRSFMALAEDTIRTAELDIDAIRLGADISEQRSFLEQEEIQRSGEAGVASLQATTAAGISRLDAAVRGSAISGAVSTVGSVIDFTAGFQNLAKTQARTPSPKITPKRRS